MTVSKVTTAAGQTGRKLVMDHYGPRIPIGGGALAGKDFAHIDRLGSIAARSAAIAAVESGAVECKITLVYGSGRNEPLDVIYDIRGRGTVLGKEYFGYERMKVEFPAASLSTSLGVGENSFINGSRILQAELSKEEIKSTNDRNPKHLVSFC